MSLRLSSKTIRLRRAIKATGKARPSALLAGKRVALKVKFKKGQKWVRVKSARVTVNSSGAYSWKYKPRSKGVYRIKASIAGTAAYKTCTSRTVSFRVK